MAESCCSSGKQREGEGDRDSNGGGWGERMDGGMQTKREKEKGGCPLERLSSPQSQPGTTVFLPARQPSRPPSVPAPAPEWRGGGIAARAALAAPFFPHPGTVHQAARRRRMRGDHRQGTGALWQAGWVGRHLQRDGVLWRWQYPQHPSRFPAQAAGDGMHREDGCSAATGSAGASTAGLGQQPGPGGAAGMGVRRPRQDQSSPPTPSERDGGLLDLCHALLQLAQPPAGSHPLDRDPHICTSGSACTPMLPGHRPSPASGPELQAG